MGEARRRRSGGKGLSMLVTLADDTIVTDGCVKRLCGSPIEDPKLGRAIAEMVATWTRKALEEQGAAAFTSPLEHAALHEAGHCVAAAALGWRPLASWVQESAPGLWLGRTTWAEEQWRATPQTAPEDDWRFAAIIIAGWAAENTRTDARAGSSFDEMALHHLLCDGIAAKLTADPMEIRRISLAAMRWLLGEVYRDALASVSAALITARRLDADELAKLLADVPYAGLDPVAEIFSTMRSKGIK